MWPLEYYRKFTGRDRLAAVKLFKNALCFICEVTDMFDPADAETFFNVPEWKHYMIKGTWPWEEDEEESDDDED